MAAIHMGKVTLVGLADHLVPKLLSEGKIKKVGYETYEWIGD